MKIRAWSCSFPPAVLMIVLLSLLLGGCATAVPEHEQRPSMLTSACASLDCMKVATMEPLYERCMQSLFRYSRYPKEQEAIDAEFGYPLRSVEGFNGWIRAGGSGPTPHDWCRHYAYEKVSRSSAWGLR